MTAAVALGGAGGFIGRALARALARERRPALGFGREGLSLETCPELDALVWAGGSREGGPDALAEAHVAAPLRALEVAAARGARRALYLSSGEVYGAQPVPFREPAPRLGASPYARAKARGEDAFQHACARLGLAALVLRPGVVYGPGQRAMLLGSLRAALRAGRRFAATAGEQTRDFLHVDDLVRLVLRGLEPDAPPGVYNAGTGVETRVGEAARGLAERLGRLDLLDLGALPYRDDELMRYALDPTLARARLGFAARVPLALGLDELARADEEEPRA